MKLFFLVLANLEHKLCNPPFYVASQWNSNLIFHLRESSSPPKRIDNIKPQNIPKFNYEN